MRVSMSPLVLAILLSSQVVEAALVTIAFDGVVGESHFPFPHADWPADQYGILPPIAPGDRISGSFTFDNTSPDLAVEFDSRGEIGNYSLDEYPSTRVAFEVNGYSFVLEQPPAPSDALIEIRNYLGLDSYLFRWYGQFPEDGGVVDLLTIEATSYGTGGEINFPPEYDFVSSDQLSEIPDFSRARFMSFSYIARQRIVTLRRPPNPPPGWVGIESTTSAFSASITSMRVLSVVPEPKPILLAGVLSVATMWLRMRRRSIARQ